MHEVLRSPGHPLDEETRAFFEPRFGHDFSRVRVHTDAKAAESAKTVNALAYTVGRDIVLGAEEYRPTTNRWPLLAHELVHVIQMRDGSSATTEPVDSLELEANDVAGRFKTRSPFRIVHASAPANEILKQADSPVMPVRPEINIRRGVGLSRPNRVDDVRVIQDRLLELRYLRPTDHARESPPATATGSVPVAQLGATIDAIRALQSDVLGAARPDGRVDPGGRTLSALNRAIPRPTPAERAAVGANLAGIRETVTQGVEITGAVGNVPAAQVVAGTANLPGDVGVVQRRLVDLGYLASGHGEQPAAGIAAAIAPNRLRRTRAAIIQFQNQAVRFWRGRGEVAGNIARGVIAPNDATHRLLDRISSYREQFPTGEDIRFRDYPASAYTVHPRGTRVTGTEEPSALPEAEYTAMGLTTDQTRALQYVSSHEGKFDALNTYDRARVSFGFIQFAGGRGLPPFMALLKSRRQAAFQSMFQNYGIDVEFNVVRGSITNATIIVIDPATGRLFRGAAAEAFIRDSQKLSAIFIRAGRNIDVQRVQIEAATRDYVLPSLAARARFEADIIEVLSSPGGTVTATHVGAAARSFRQTQAFRDLQAARRIRERRSLTQATMGTLLTSQQGLAVLMDRAIQEGAGPGGGGVIRVQGAMRWVADRQGLMNISAVAGYERAVLQQVVDDFTADIAIAEHIDAGVNAIQALQRAARPRGATVARVLRQPQAAMARLEVDAALALVPNKSFVPSRSRIETGLISQRAVLDFDPAPAGIAALIALLRRLIARLRGIRPNTTNARAMRARIQNILSSALTAPS